MSHMFVHQYGGICGVNKRSYGHTAPSYSVTRLSKTTSSPSDISGKCVRFEKLLGILAISLITSGAHDRLLIRYRLMSLKTPLKDLWKLPTRQMGINSCKIYDLTTRFRAVLPCGLRRVSNEVFDEQRTGNSPQ